MGSTFLLLQHATKLTVLQFREVTGAYMAPVRVRVPEIAASSVVSGCNPSAHTPTNSQVRSGSGQVRVFLSLGLNHQLSTLGPRPWCQVVYP
jgi:hypothetical protein